MVRGSKASGSVKGKKRSNPQPPVKSLTPRVHTPGVAKEKQLNKTSRPLRGGRALVRKPIPLHHINRLLDLGLNGADTLFFVKNCSQILCKMIDERIEFRNELNLESSRLFKQGTVNLVEDSTLSNIESQKRMIERQIIRLHQVKERAFELAPSFLKKIQVFVETIQGCATDLINLRNNEIVILSEKNAKDYVGIGSRVKIEFLDNAEKKSLVIGSFFANGEEEKDEVSYASRIAQAMMGEAVGSIVELETVHGKNTKSREFRILEVS